MVALYLEPFLGGSSSRTMGQRKTITIYYPRYGRNVKNLLSANSALALRRQLRDCKVVVKVKANLSSCNPFLWKKKGLVSPFAVRSDRAGQKSYHRNAILQSCQLHPSVIVVQPKRTLALVQWRLIWSGVVGLITFCPTWCGVVAPLSNKRGKIALRLVSADAVKCKWAKVP